jgi:hypothetical protein
MGNVKDDEEDGGGDLDSESGGWANKEVVSEKGEEDEDEEDEDEVENGEKEE